MGVVRVAPGQHLPESLGKRSAQQVEDSCRLIYQVYLLTR